MVCCKEVFLEDQQVLVFRKVRRVLEDQEVLEVLEVLVLVVDNRVEMGYHMDCCSRVVEAVRNKEDEEDKVVYNSLFVRDLGVGEVDTGVVAYLRVQLNVAYLRVQSDVAFHLDQTMDQADDAIHYKGYVVVDSTVVVVKVSNIYEVYTVVVVVDNMEEGGNNFVGSKDPVDNTVVGNTVARV